MWALIDETVVCGACEGTGYFQRWARSTSAEKCSTCDGLGVYDRIGIERG